MTSVLSKFLAAVATVLLFVSPTGFWVAAGVTAFFLFVSYKGLKRAPTCSLDGLSSEAEDLLNRFNHAWSSPGFTKSTASALGLWQLLCLVAALVFVFRQDWWSLLAIFMLFNLFTYMAGFVNPRPYIARKSLLAAHDEIRLAYLTKYGNMQGPPEKWKKLINGSSSVPPK